MMNAPIDALLAVLFDTLFGYVVVWLHMALGSTFTVLEEVVVDISTVSVEDNFI